MGTKVQSKSYLLGYHPMGDLNVDSNSGTWPVFYGDKPLSTEQFHNPQLQRTIADAYFGYHTEAVKQKMLEHEAIFKTQLYELHRLYQVQRDLMDEMKMNELHKQSMAIETSMSSCSASQRQDAQGWNTSSAFPLSSSASAKPAVVGAKDFFNSTPNFLTGKSPQNGLVSCGNAGGSKDCEVEILECRPSNTRRKFNLELRADEYIDVEELDFISKRPPGVSRYPCNGSCDDPPSSSTKMFFGGSVKNDSRGDGARLKNCENGVADLNEQIHIQGQNSSSLNFVGCDSNFQSKQQFCSKSRLQTFPREFMQSSYRGRDDSRSRNLIIAQKDNGRLWSHMIDSARSKGQTTPFSQNSISEKINLFNKGQDGPYFRTGQIKAGYWKERSKGGPKHSGNGVDFLNCLSNGHQSDNSFSTSAPWEKSGSCITQKSATAEMHACFISAATLPQSLQSSSKSAWTPEQGWQNNSDGGKDNAYQDGFYKGSCSSSGPARCPSTSSDYLNCGNPSYMASGHTICQNGSIILKGLNSIDASSAKGIDLNIASVGDSHDFVDRPNRDLVADFPWLTSSGGLKNGEIQSFNSSVTGPGSTAYDMEAKPGVKRIMGVPILGESHAFKGASSSLEKMDIPGRVRGFDMNLPCESEEKDAESPAVSGRNHIDLNLCLTEYEEVLTTSAGSEKIIIGFDLEAPGETEEDLIGLKQQRPEHLDEDLVTVAAETICGISSRRKLSSPVDKPVALEWFVNVITPGADEADRVAQEVNMEEADSIDYFEYMTLQLSETKEEEYLPDYPKPREPEEQTGAGLCATRTRKGQARRCRPRRDFQRDILPGLASLARHEVTEDLQTFGGLMRAMGHSWQSGLTRRAGPRRGRPRSTPVQPPTSPSPPPPKKPNTSDAVTTQSSSASPQKRSITTTTITDELMNMEDQRSLTGWGKTTRRPRRQRCPTGNNNASVLRIA